MIDGEILRFAALQLNAAAETIHAYARRQQTVSEHQQFDIAGGEQLTRFLESEALRLDRTGSLLARARGWLRDEHVLAPADSVLRRTRGGGTAEGSRPADATNGRAPVGSDARRS